MEFIFSPDVRTIDDIISTATQNLLALPLHKNKNYVSDKKRRRVNVSI